MFSLLRNYPPACAWSLLVASLAACTTSTALEAIDNARSPSSTIDDDRPSSTVTNEEAEFAPIAKGDGAIGQNSGERDEGAESGSGESSDSYPVTSQPTDARQSADDAPAPMPTPQSVAPRASRAAEAPSAESYAPSSSLGGVKDPLALQGAPSTKRSRAPRERSYNERPGLGTTWGEDRISNVHEVDFIRHSPQRPSALFRFQYNDERGLIAQLGEYACDRFIPNYVQSPHRFVTVEIVDPNGTALPGATEGDRTYVLGRNGDRYAIRVRNNEPRRFEVVASVDGLDVIGGNRASYTQPGYVLDAYGTLLIEGFRRSTREVATFRFGSVRDSYTARSGQGDRNVGVIGVAVFEERHARPAYPKREIELRESADPFPSRFARPPGPISND